MNAPNPRKLVECFEFSLHYLCLFYQTCSSIEDQANAVLRVLIDLLLIHHKHHRDQSLIDDDHGDLLCDVWSRMVWV